MPINDVVEVKLVTSTFTQVGINVRHYILTNVAGVENPYQLLVNSVNAAVGPFYRDCIGDTARYEGVLGRRILPAPPSATFQAIAGAGPGTVAGSLLAKQTSGLITFRSLGVGRRGRGRTYLSFPPEDLNELDGIPSAAYIAAAANVGAELSLNRVVGAAPDLDTWVPVLLSRDTGIPTGILSFSVRQRWATQRRRGDFGKPNVPPLP